MLESTWPFKLEIPSLSKLEKQTFHVETQLSRSLPHGHYRYLHGFICRPEKAPDLLRRLPDSVEVQSGFFERRVKRVGERERFRKNPRNAPVMKVHCARNLTFMIYLCMPELCLSEFVRFIMFQDSCDWPQDAEFSVRHFAKEWGGSVFCLQGMWHASKKQAWRDNNSVLQCYKLQNCAIVSFYMTFCSRDAK